MSGLCNAVKDSILCCIVILSLLAITFENQSYPTKLSYELLGMAPGEGFEPSWPWGHRLSWCLSRLAPFQARRPRLLILIELTSFYVYLISSSRSYLSCVRIINQIYIFWNDQSLPCDPEYLNKIRNFDYIEYIPKLYLDLYHSSRLTIAIKQTI